MATTAVARPLARASRAREEHRAGGLAFDTLGGPLVAVCGLAGGAGTTTLSYLLAQQAASHSAAPVLLTEADTQCAGLAHLTGHATPRPLDALAADAQDEQQPPSSTFVELSLGLRLIAAKPQRSASVRDDALAALLADARGAHGLVVIDCATSWSASCAVLARATHILWTLPATPLALARAIDTLDGVSPPPGRWREALVATATTPRPDVRVRALRRAARTRCDRLVLIPHDRALQRVAPTPSDAICRALAGLASTLKGHA